MRIAPFVRRAATPFEWSAARLRDVGCAAEWVGHPALENVPDESARAAMRERFGVAEGVTLVALLPGSRPSARDQRRVYLPDFDRTKLDPFRILIVSPRATHEVQATFPAVSAIQQGRPDTWLAVLTPADADDQWRAVSEIAQVIIWNDADAAEAIASRVRVVASFDAAVFFAPESQTARAVWHAEIPIRVGRRAGLPSRFFNQHPPEPDGSMDAVAANLQIAQSIGANINEAITRRPRV